LQVDGPFASLKKMRDFTTKRQSYLDAVEKNLGIKGRQGEDADFQKASKSALELQGCESQWTSSTKPGIPCLGVQDYMHTCSARTENVRNLISISHESSMFQAFF